MTTSQPVDYLTQFDEAFVQGATREDLLAIAWQTFLEATPEQRDRMLAKARELAAARRVAA